MIKVYSFCDPRMDSFAYAIRRGSWYPEGSKVCPECHSSRQKRVSPLILEWEPGSDRIGDFVWPGFNDEMVVTQTVRESLEKLNKEIIFNTIQFIQNKSLKKPSKLTKRYQPRVWLPYSGPALWDVKFIKYVHLDLDLSGITLYKVCPTCGEEFYRSKAGGDHLKVIDKTSWEGEKLFHVYEHSGLFICTEEVKNIIEKSGFTNVGFKEYGIIPT